MQDGKIFLIWNSSHFISIPLKFIETESLCIKCQPFVQLCLLRMIKWYWITASEWAFQGQPWQFVAIKMQILFQHSITKHNAYFWKHILFFSHTWERGSRVCEGHWGCLLQFWFQPKLWLFCDINIHMKTLVKIMPRSCHFLRSEDTGKKGVSKL